MSRLKTLGVKDSKLLTPKKRQELFHELLKVIHDYYLIIVEPLEIDKAVNSIELNLNWLEAQKAAEITNYLRPDKVILDCPSPNLEKYATYFKQYLYKPIEVICEHKADVNHVVVSAASIIAKEYREKDVEKIKKEIGIDFGSGYLSDPLTKKFLEEHFEHYGHHIRKSWVTYKDLVKKKHQKTLGDF